MIYGYFQNIFLIHRLQKNCALKPLIILFKNGLKKKLCKLKNNGIKQSFITKIQVGFSFFNILKLFVKENFKKNCNTAALLKCFEVTKITR